MRKTMRSYSNISKIWLRFLMGKPVIFIIFLSLIIALNGWMILYSARQSGMGLYNKSAGAKLSEKTSPDAASPVSVPSDQKVLPKKSFAEIPLSPRQKKAEKRYQHLVLKAAVQYEVEPEIIKAIILAESGFNPKAVSKVGAKGLMQLMPRTARHLGVKDSFKPAHNIDAGVRYFKQLLDQFDGKIKLALAAYNAGSHNVIKYKGIPPFKATRIYIDKVLKYYRAYQMT